MILRPHGIKGEIKVKHYCDNPEDFSMFGWIYLKQGKHLDKREIINARTDSGDVYLLISGVLTRNDAEDLRGKTLYVEKTQIRELPEDRFFIRDLIGMTVITDDGEPLGTLKEILQHGAVDVYRVEDEGKGLMFPALKRVIKKTDIKAKQITVDTASLKEVVVYDD